VVSESNRAHDYQTKLQEYAAAGIPEYWIIDPADNTIRIFALRESAYIQDGEFRFGQLAKSKSLAGFEVDVSALFSQAAAQA